MIPSNIQKIYRELCELNGMVSQKEIAKRCNCSLSYVNKVIKVLKNKKYIHQPLRNRISVLNFQNLLLYWAFKRDLEDEKIKIIRTNYKPLELEKEAGRAFKNHVFGLFTAASALGIKIVPYNDVYIYSMNENIKKIKEGNKARLIIITTDDNHLFSKSKIIDSKRIAPASQTFVDLASLNTWESKYTAMKISEIDSKYPVFGTKKELEELL